MDILLLIAGIVLLFKKEVRISKTRALSGRPVKVLAVLYILPMAVGTVGGALVNAKVITFGNMATVSMVLVAGAIMMTLYYILFYKPVSGDPHALH